MYLGRLGFFTPTAIALHNFPEGVATFLAALDDPRTGVVIAIAVALRNVPEVLACIAGGMALMAVSLLLLN